VSNSRLVRWGARADRLGRALETFLLALVLSAMILLAATQIVLRNLSGGGIVWADEALRILVLWVAMLGAVAASRDQRHVSIDAVSRYLPSAVRWWISLFVNLFAATVCIVLAWYSYEFIADSRLADDRVLGGAVSAWVMQFILPVGFALLGYRYLVACVTRQAIPIADAMRH